MPFSLIEDRWIPAIAADGTKYWITPGQIGERDAQGQPRWIDLDWGRPDLRIATYELLIGLFATALAPQDSDALRALWDEPPSPADLEQALQPLSPFLWLDGEGPRVLQALEAIEGEANPPDALFMDAPGANTIRNGADFFVKRGRTPVLSRKAAAIALYALQAFAPSGGAGHRTSMRGGGPLTTLVVPPNPDLWSRIAINLPLFDDPERLPPEDLSFVFPWARATRVSRGDIKTAIGPAHHTHWLQHYFGMPRRIRLDFEPNDEGVPCALTGEVDAVVVTGFRMEAYGANYDGWTHPLSPYYEGKTNELLPFHARSGRNSYRDWVGYLFAGGEKGAVSHPAEVVNTFVAMEGGVARPVRMLIAGYITDNMKTEDYLEAEVPLLVLPDPKARRWQEQAVRNRLLQPAEMVVTELRRRLIDAVGGDFKKTGIASVVEQFWNETERAFLDALEDVTALYRDEASSDARSDKLDRIIARWLAVLRDVALRLYRQNAPLDQLADLPQTQRAAIIEANEQLHLVLLGYRKGGQALFAQAGLPLPEKKPSPSLSDTGAPS